MYEQNEIHGTILRIRRVSRKCTTAIPNREMHPTVWLSLP